MALARALPLAAAAACAAAAAPSVGDVHAHDHGASHLGLMRKEVAASTSAAPGDGVGSILSGSLTPEPAGYYNRGEDCPGGHPSNSSFAPLFMRNTPVADCAAHCDKMHGCRGFTYNRNEAICYFKDFACNTTQNNGWEFFQKETCDYTSRACEAAVNAQPWLTKAEPFVVDGDIQGCYTYITGVNKTVAFYGRLKGKDVRVHEELSVLTMPLQPVPGYGCAPGAFLAEAAPAAPPAAPAGRGPTSLVAATLQAAADEAAASSALESMDAAAMLQEDLVLEDELDRVAGLSQEQLREEAAAHGLPWPPAAPRRLELLRPSAAATPAALAQEASPLAVVPEEDEEDRRRFPQLAAQP